MPAADPLLSRLRKSLIPVPALRHLYRVHARCLEVVPFLLRCMSEQVEITANDASEQGETSMEATVEEVDALAAARNDATRR